MIKECCANCRYLRRLKHNFKREMGFEESYCCSVWLRDPNDIKSTWVQEVSPNDMCEMFTEIGEG